MKKSLMPLSSASDRGATPRLSAFFPRLVERPRESDGGGRSFFRTCIRAPRLRATLLRAALLLLLCCVLVGVSVLTVSLAMVDVTSERITTIDALAADHGLSEYDCILVLGAGVRADGSPSDMLRDRVTVACNLYEAMKEPRVPLLMSGDHTGSYNEVSAMKKLAAELGVPSERIFLDHEGYSTYESLYRAKHVFGARRIVIITQQYHLHRALHIAGELGMDAVGISSDLRPYRGQTRYEAREMLARFKDMLAAAKKPEGGTNTPPIDLGGDGNLTN